MSCHCNHRRQLSFFRPNHFPITAGVLVLVPNHPMFNLLVTSFVFVCAAHEINVVTGVLVNYFVPPGDSRKMARNLAIFAVVMIVLAINDGMIW